MAFLAALHDGIHVGRTQAGLLGDLAEVVLDDAPRVRHMELRVGGQRVAVALRASDSAMRRTGPLIHGHGHFMAARAGAGRAGFVDETRRGNHQNRGEKDETKNYCNLHVGDLLLQPRAFACVWAIFSPTR